jgi:hypothetical protein
MNSATKSKPQFRVGDWVSYQYLTARVMAQIIEDRGHLGYRGRRLYDLRIDRSQPDPRLTSSGEEELEKAPAELLTADEARRRGFATSNWPRQEFAIRYTRKGKTNHWTVKLEIGQVREGAYVSGVVSSSRAGWEAGVSTDETVIIVTVLLEYDPRFRDVRSDPVFWPAMVEEARMLADQSFKRQHAKAVIERE